MTLEFLNGTKISVKHSTLSLEENLLLAKQFNDEEWVNAHKSKNKDSEDVIIVTEYSDSFFKKMNNHLRLRSILKSAGCESPYISVKNIDERQMFYKFVSNFFPSNEELIINRQILYDSLILKTSEETNTILS